MKNSVFASETEAAVISAVASTVKCSLDELVTYLCEMKLAEQNDHDFLCQFIVSTLNEAKIDKLKISNPSWISELDQISIQVKPKYLDWCLRELKAGSQPEQLIKAVTFFDQNFQKYSQKDINFYDLKTLEQLNSKIDQKSSLKKASTDNIKSGSIKLYDQDELLLLRIDNEAASIKYGQNTKWCISGDKDNLYSTHRKMGETIYFIIDRSLGPENTLSKIALTIGPGLIDKNSQFVGCWNAKNRAIDSSRLPKKYQDLIEIAKRDQISRQ